MKSARNYLIVLLLLTTAAGLALSYKEYQQVTALHAQLDSPADGLQKRLTDALATIRKLRDQLAAVRNTEIAARGPGGAADDAAGSGPVQGRGRGGQQWFAARQQIWNSPQFQALRSVQEKAMLDQRYAQLFRNLVQAGATPQQIDQLKDLLVQRQQATMDAFQAARQNGINPRSDPTAFQQAVADATSDVDNQIKSALGDSGYATYQQYQQTLPEQNTVSRVQQELSYTSTPLTDAQAQQLVQVLQQTQPQSANAEGGFRRFFGGPGEGPSAVVTQQTLAQASSVLAPAQLQALQQIQQQQQAQQQMEQLMRGAKLNQKSPVANQTASTNGG